MNEKWPEPSKELPRVWHEVFGWGRCIPPISNNKKTLFYPEVGTKWRRGGGEPDEVAPNEPILVPFTELHETEENTEVHVLTRMALSVERT